MASGARIALEADPDDPEDGDVTVEALEAALAERRARLAGDKDTVSLELDREAIARLKAAGPEWKTRINEAVRKAAGL